MSRSHLLPGSLHLLTILFGIAMIVVLTLWLLPVWQVSRSPGLTAANRFDRENEARKTLAQIIGGVLVLAGLYSSIKTFDLQRQTESLQEQGQITDRFTKAIDQIGAVLPGGQIGPDGRPKINLEERLGGIYALERIAQDSPQRDDWTIMEVLAAYVRENAPITDQAPTSLEKDHESVSRVRIDVQAALDVIGRRQVKDDLSGRRLDLQHTDLRAAYLGSTHLENADLSGSDLEGAFLVRAHLNAAILVGAHLNNADLSGCHLEGAILIGVQWTGAYLDGAYLDGAYLRPDDATIQNLLRSQKGVVEINTAIEPRYSPSVELDPTDLTGPLFHGTYLRSAHLATARGITEESLIGSHGDSHTELPPGVHRPADWPR